MKSVLFKKCGGEAEERIGHRRSGTGPEAIAPFSLDMELFGNSMP
jgi:hypothetical protein